MKADSDGKVLTEADAILPDLHIHTPFCGHARGTMEESVQNAIRLGCKAIGFAGHFPYPPGFNEPFHDCVIPKDRFPNYVEEVHRLQKMYRDRIAILLAAEIDYFKGYTDQTEAMCRDYSFDYIIGSVHFVEGVAIDHSEDMLQAHLEELGGIRGLWEKYWQCMENLIDWEMCDVVAHFDLPQKFVRSQCIPDFTERVDSLLKKIRDRDLVLEVNTGGIDRSLHQETYPSLPILRMAVEKGIEITLGSDAHAPEEVGRHFRKTEELLKSLGWKKVVFFEKGEKKYCSI